MKASVQSSSPLSNFVIHTASLIDTLNLNGESPLHIAVRLHHYDIIQLLIKKGMV